MPGVQVLLLGAWSESRHASRRGGVGTVTGCWWNEDRVAGTLSQCPGWARGLAGVWLAQQGSCPAGTQLLSISHQRRVCHRTGVYFILLSRGRNDEMCMEVISLLAHCRACSKCLVNECGMNKFKRRKEEKRRQQFTPCHRSMQMSSPAPPAHTHTTLATEGVNPLCG